MKGRCPGKKPVKNEDVRFFDKEWVCSAIGVSYVMGRELADEGKC